MVALTLAVSLAEAPFFPASSAAIPNLVDEEDLAWANGLLAASRSVGVLAGPVLGGVTVALLGAGGAFLCNAASFLVSAALVAAAHGSFSAAAHGRVLPDASGLSAGYRFLWRDRVGRIVSPAMGLLFLGMGLGMTADAPLIARLHGGALSYAALIVAWGAGEIAGGLLFPRVARRLAHHALGGAGARRRAARGGRRDGRDRRLAPPVVRAPGHGGRRAVRRADVRPATGPPAEAHPGRASSRVIAAVDTLSDGGQIVGLVAAGAVVGARGPLAAYGASGLVVASAGLVVLGLSATAGFVASSEESPLPEPPAVGSARFPHVAAEQATGLTSNSQVAYTRRMDADEELLRRAYAAFNARDVEAAVALMREDVDWPNGMEGGRVHGRNGVRAYWTRQFGLIDARRRPRGLRARATAGSRCASTRSCGTSTATSSRTATSSTPTGCATASSSAWTSRSSARRQDRCSVTRRTNGPRSAPGADRGRRTACTTLRCARA